jgi:hypothetical protein
MPFFDEDIGVLYLCGKGSGWIKCYEIVAEQPYAHYLTEHASPNPLSGCALLPKAVVDVTKVEVARFLRLCKDRVEPITWSTPRTRKEFFQDDVYPATRARAPSGKASEFFASSAALFPPKLVSLRPANMPLLSEAPPLPEAVNARTKFAKDMEADRSNARTESLIAQFAGKVNDNRGEDITKVIKVADAENCVADDEWD